MILTTTPQIEGKPIAEYIAVVSGEAIIGANAAKDFMASFRDIVGGRSKSYEKVIREGKETSLKELAESAEALGANGVVGISFSYEAIGTNGSMLMVAATGTAVRY
ncbi:MAG: heavy metal-binding domain-containing protein [Rikenellaceae bacterium]